MVIINSYKGSLSKRNYTELHRKDHTPWVRPIAYDLITITITIIIVIIILLLRYKREKVG